MHTKIIDAITVVAAMLLLSIRPAGADVIEESFDFQIDSWQEIDQSSDGVTIHRVRLTRDKGGVMSAFTGGVNEKYYERITVELEYSNEGDKKVKTTFLVKILDADDEGIDGFETKLSLKKKSDREVGKQAITSSKYAIGKAAKLNIQLTL